MTSEALDIEAVVLTLDPDPFDHFASIEDAAEHYQRWSPKEWAEAVREVTGDE